MINIYLAGPININLDQDTIKIEDSSLNWRKEIKKIIINDDITFLDPILNSISIIEKIENKEDFIDMKQNIFEKDMELINKTDVVICNLMEFNIGYPCIGTFIEIGIFLEKRKKVYIISDNSKIKMNPMLSKCFIFTDIYCLVKKFKEDLKI